MKVGWRWGADQDPRVLAIADALPIPGLRRVLSTEITGIYPATLELYVREEP